MIYILYHKMNKLNHLIQYTCYLVLSLLSMMEGYKLKYLLLREVYIVLWNINIMGMHNRYVIFIGYCKLMVVGVYRLIVNNMGNVRYLI